MSTITSLALSVVIIDDNPKSLELLSSALAQPGLEILTASDPEQGLDLVYNKHPQIVLTDLVMPHLSGMDVLERIMEFDPSTDVILMTAHYSTETAVEAIKKGASDYLNKPISLAALRERVGKLIEEARRQQRSIQLEGELLASSEFEGICASWRLFPRKWKVAADRSPVGAGRAAGGARGIDSQENQNTGFSRSLLATRAGRNGARTPFPSASCCAACRREHSPSNER